MNLLIVSKETKHCGLTQALPLNLLYLAAMDSETKIIDLTLNPDINIAKYIKQHKPKVVGVTVYTPNRHEAFHILKIAKNNGAITVAGGPHISLLIKQLIKYYGNFVDHFVLGDGEFAWKSICNGEKNNKIIKGKIQDLDSINIPNWDSINWKDYNNRDFSFSTLKSFNGLDLKSTYPYPIAFGRGCEGNCSFCSTWWVNGKYTHHGKDWMYEALNRLNSIGVKRLNFVDDCITANKDALFELCEILRKFNFIWWASARVDEIDVDIAREVKKSGCIGMAFGVETSSELVLKNMNKKIVDKNASLNTRQIFKDYNLYFRALMMNGFPGMTAETVKNDSLFLQELKPDEVGTVGETWVLPGTTLYTKCKRQGLITDDFWMGTEPYYICPPNLKWTTNKGNK